MEEAVKSGQAGQPEAPQIEIIAAAAEQAPVLANLLELYIHDFSEFHNVEPGPDGRFGYEPLPLYWTDPNRHPFFARNEGKLAGFVLVKKSSEGPGGDSVWDMAEFFVLRRYRRRGIGTRMAHAVWRSFPGRWQVRVMESNQAGLRFWERAITSFAGEAVRSIRVKKADKYWRVFSFDSQSGS